jgi:hypothetical protein
MKEKTWKHKIKQEKQKKFDKFKYLKRISKEEILTVPEKFQGLYSSLSEPMPKKGNSLSKPLRYAKELKLNQQRKIEIEQKIKNEEIKAQENLQKNIKKKKTARMLSRKNYKGQPKLKNTIFHLCNKLGILKN